MFRGLIVVACAFGLVAASSNALGDDFESSSSLRPSATDGLGRMFSSSQSLVQALDTMVWFTLFGGVISSNTPSHKKVGPICKFDMKSTSSFCGNVQLTRVILENELHRDMRRRFHTTLTHIHHIREKAIRSINAIGLYYTDKTLGSRYHRCLIYGHYGDIKQDWPRFLTAFRDDRRGLSRIHKDFYGLYFAYARRTYSEYLNVMDKLAPDLEELCEDD